MASLSILSLGLAAHISTPSKTATTARAIPSPSHYGTPARGSTHHRSAGHSRTRQQHPTDDNAVDDYAYISDSHPSTPGRYGPTLTQYAAAHHDQDGDTDAYDEAAARLRRETESTPPSPPTPGKPTQQQQQRLAQTSQAVTGNASDSSLSDCSLLSDMTLPDMDPSEDWEVGLREAGIDLRNVSGGSGDEENVAPYGYADGGNDGSATQHKSPVKRRRLGLAEPLQARGGTSAQGSARAGTSKRNGEKDYRQPTSTNRVTTVTKTYRSSRRRRRVDSAGANVSHSDMDISTDGQSGDSSSGIEVASTRKPTAPSARCRTGRENDRDAASTSASPLESRPPAPGRKPAKTRAKAAAVGMEGLSESEDHEVSQMRERRNRKDAVRVPSTSRRGQRNGSTEDAPNANASAGNPPPERRRSTRKGKERASDEDDESDSTEAKRTTYDNRNVTAKAAEMPFQALSTATTGPALTALEIIAQLRARNMASRGMQADTSMDQSSGALPDGRGASAAAVPAVADDDSDDDLADPSLLIKRAAIRPTAAPAPVSAVAQPDPSVPKPIINTKTLPKDKSKFALDKLYKSRQAEGGRGWFGIEQAGQQAAATHANSSDEEGERSAALDSGHAEGEADLSRHSSGASASAGAGGKNAMDRLNAALQKDQRSLEAVQILKEETEEMRHKKKKEEDRESRKFWISDDDLRIEPCVPYEPAGRTGLDLAICQGIIDGLADPFDFPIQLCSTFLSSPETIRSTIPSMHALYNLVAHPCTTPQLAELALRMLTCLLEKLPSGEQLDTDIELHHISDSLLKMGAKPDHIPETLLEAGNVQSAMQGVEIGASTGQDRKQLFTAQDRRAASLRLLQVVKVLVATGRSFREYAMHTVKLLLSLVWVPDDLELRSAAFDTLRYVLGYVKDDYDSHNVYHTLATTWSLGDAKDRYLGVISLPACSPKQQALIRSLCFALVFETSSPELEPDLNLAKILSHLPSPRGVASTEGDGQNVRKGPVNIFADVSEETTDSRALYYSILTLQILLGDIPRYLAGSETGVRERDELRAIIQSLRLIDSKLRNDVRASNPMRNKAKNALTRLTHCLEYLLDAHQKVHDAAERKKRIGKGHTADDKGQISLKGFLTLPKRPASATPTPGAVP